MMLLHQHFQRAERHAKHLCKLDGIHCVLLRREHTRLFNLNLLEFRDGFSIATADTHRLQLPLVLFIFQVSLWELLPIVVNLLINESVSFLEDLTNVIVYPILNVHLHANELFQNVGRGLEGVDLGTIRVLEVVSC